MILQNYQNFTEMYHLLWTTNRNLEYCISANSFRGNYSFLKLTLCTVTFDHSTYRCGNYSREETIQGRKLFAEIQYLINSHLDVRARLPFLCTLEIPTIKSRKRGVTIIDAAGCLFCYDQFWSVYLPCVCICHKVDT